MLAAALKEDLIQMSLFGHSLQCLLALLFYLGFRHRYYLYYLVFEASLVLFESIVYLGLQGILPETYYAAFQGMAYIIFISTYAFFFSCVTDLEASRPLLYRQLKLIYKLFLYTFIPTIYLSLKCQFPILSLLNGTLHIIVCILIFFVVIYNNIRAWKEHIFYYSAILVNLSSGIFAIGMVVRGELIHWNDPVFYLLIIPASFLETILFNVGFVLKQKEIDIKFSDLIKKESKQKLLELEVRSTMLKAQLHPHTLGNILNHIQHFIALGENTRAMDLLHGYSLYMRRLLKSSGTNIHSMHKELELALEYLNLAVNRLGGRFSFEIEDRLHDDKVMIPAMLLLPLIENTLEHSFKESNVNHVHLRIELRQTAGVTEILLVDDGAGPVSEGSDDEALSERGYGLANVRDQLIVYTSSTGIRASLESGNRTGLDGCRGFYTRIVFKEP